MARKGSIDGDEYFPVGAAQSATPGVGAVPETIQFLRTRVTSFTSGAPKADARRANNVTESPRGTRNISPALRRPGARRSAR